MVASKDNNLISDIAEKARDGCQDSLGQLCEHFRDDIGRYVYRLTLDQNLTEDIQQETLLQMCKSIKDLRDVSSIRAWLFKTAWSKAMDHFNSKKKHRYMSIHENSLVNAMESKSIENLKTLISKEVAETLVESISKLDIKQRSVLILRCYESLAYSEIASAMNCSETSARVHFYRAKMSLKKRLGRKGITAPMFLGLLGLFGQVTWPSQASASVSASSLKVGGLGATIGWVLSKTGALILSLLAASFIAAAAILANTPVGDMFSENAESKVQSFHFTKHAWKKAYIPTANLRMGRSLSKGAYEQWMFFPEGVEGPMFKMTQRWDPTVKNKLCGWLLNEDGLHYYHSGEKTIYLMNDPLGRRRTARFPSDSQEFCEFLDSIEGKEEGLEYRRDPKTGLLMEIVDRRFANAKDFVSGVESNVLDEKTFGDFRYKWPTDPKFVDERDAIHKQRWTLFRISGKINGETVYGSCRIPFVYGALEEFPPLLCLNIGSEYTIIDSVDGAYITDSNYKVIASYPSGSFFKGLVRPWFGLHTIDLLRREAAKCRVPFEIENLEYDGYSHQKRILTLNKAPGYNGISASFTVDIGKNEIRQIEFTNENKVSLGTLKFSYPSGPDSIGDPVDVPKVKKRWRSGKEPIGILWLFELAKGTLADE